MEILSTDQVPIAAIFGKSSVLDVCQGSEYTAGICC